MISIGIPPDIFEIGSFNPTWHSLVTVVSVALAVYLIDRWGRREGLQEGAVTSTAVWAIIGGIVGARLVFVIDNWGFFSDNPDEIFAIWEGGIAVYGAISGGVVGGAAYAAWKQFPVRYMLDLSAPALILTQGLGRIGDIINGEHFASATSLPWGVVYTHPDSPARFHPLGYGVPPFTATHPAVAYELLADLILFGVLWLLRGRLRPLGSLFLVYALFYGGIRLGFSFLRLDSSSEALGLNQQAWISLVVMGAALALLAWLRPGLTPPVRTAPEGPRPSRTTRRRRRRR